MSLLMADLAPPVKGKVIDPSPSRHPPLTDQSKWCSKYVSEMRLLPRTQFFGFSKFKIMSRCHEGPAELMRLLLAYASVPFEDVIVSYVDWKCLMSKLPYGNLPVLYVDHNIYGEVNSIVRLLAKSLSMSGITQKEAFMASAVLCQVTDLKESTVLQKAFEELQERADDNFDKAIKYLLPQNFTFWEAHIASTPGPYVLSSGISVADLAIFDFIHQYRQYLPIDNLLVNYKCLKTLFYYVQSDPAISLYLKKLKATQTTA